MRSMKSRVEVSVEVVAICCSDIISFGRSRSTRNLFLQRMV
jgi:hypothetical protein